MLGYIFILPLLAPAIVFARTEGIRPCSDERPFVDEVRVDGCAQTPCDVFQGSDVVMEVDFRTSEPASQLRPQVYATALNTTIEYVLPPELQNGCNHLKVGSCPLSANEDATYRFLFNVMKIYPPIRVSVELIMWNELKQVMWCAVIDIQVRI